MIEREETRNWSKEGTDGRTDGRWNNLSEGTDGRTILKRLLNE